MARGMRELMTADDNAIVTFTMTDMFAGALARGAVRAIFDQARIICDDVEVYESKAFLGSSFNAKITGRVADVRRIYSKLEAISS